MRKALFLISVLAAGPAWAQEPDPANGQVLYSRHCSQCHGPDAKGNGPMAEILAIAPPDLTQLAAHNDGVFPTEAVARQIDGRAPILAHGGEMPVFGPFFGGDDIVVPLPSGQPMMTSLAIADLLAFLESIQTGGKP
ncbi:MAG: c-type cytochrome [Rhodobacteraceae bacterium]|nr:c-type cytochrome [Paracoccaceae bacterium]